MSEVEYVSKISHYNSVDLTTIIPEELNETYSPIEIYYFYLALINKNLAAEKVDPQFIEEENLSNLDSSVQRAHYLGRKLEELGSVLGLEREYLSVRTGSQYLQIRSGDRAISVIQPTHVMKGAVFVLPHEDHMRDTPLESLPKVQVGEWVRIAKDCRLDIGAGLVIGDRVWIGKNVHRYGHAHSKDYMGILRQSSLASSFDYPILIQDDAMVGFNSEVANTVDYIGEGSIIGQESMVTKWVGDFSILVGNNRTLSYLPAHAFFKHRYGNNMTLDQLAQVDWDGELLSEYEAFSNIFLKEGLLNRLVSSDKFPIKRNAKSACLSIGVDETTLSSIANGLRTDSISASYQDIAHALTVATHFGNTNYRNRREIDKLRALGNYDRYHITIDAATQNESILPEILCKNQNKKIVYISFPSQYWEQYRNSSRFKEISRYSDEKGVVFLVVKNTADDKN